MTVGTIVVVHGTGVRLKTYRPSFETAERTAREAGVTTPFLECAWGDAVGVEFDGWSIPEPPSDEQVAAEDEENARWAFLLEDPFYELDKLTIPDREKAAFVPGTPPWKKAYEFVKAYQPTQEFQALLVRGGLEKVWPVAWDALLGSPIPYDAFEKSHRAVTEVVQAMARAAIAQLHVAAIAKGLLGPSPRLRIALYERLNADWPTKTLGVMDFFTRTVKRLATAAIRRNRMGIMNAAALPVGDILLYQVHGHKIRDFIRTKLQAAQAPITLVAHSLGGIACFDLLMMPDAPKVDRFVTVGSQSAFFYEIGASESAQRPPRLTVAYELPVTFPRWLNIYDRSDFLSFIAARVFSRVEDREVKSGQPFPDAHSAYFGNEDVWTAIKGF